MRRRVALLCRDIRRYGPAILALGLLLLLATVLGQGVCLLRNLTGFPCPACGISRSAILFLQGKWAESIRLQPFFAVWALYGLAVLTERYLLLRNGKWKRAVLIFLLAAMAVWYMYGMIRFFGVREPYLYKEDNLLQRRLWRLTK